MKKTSNIEMGKVLIIVENSWVPIDRRVWYEATTLRDAGWDVSVICPAPKGAHAGSVSTSGLVVWKPDDINGITVFRFPLTFAESGVLNYLKEYLVAFFSIAFLSIKIWKDEGFDIIHFCNPPDIFFPIAIFYRLLGVSIIFDHHDLFTENIKYRFKGMAGKLLYWAARIFEKLSLKVANRVISTNQSYKQIALDRANLPTEKVVIVRNGPKISEFTPCEPDSNIKQGFEFMVCYVGVMAEEDGIFEISEIVRHFVFNRQRTDTLFTLIGDGSTREKVLDELTLLGLMKYVDMPGMIRDDSILLSYMSAADLDLVVRFANWLYEHKTETKHGIGWGYNFDWPNRGFFAPAGTPTIVNTAFIGLAFLDLYDLACDGLLPKAAAWTQLKSLDMAYAACQFIMNDLTITTRGDDQLCFSYTPLDRRYVHNANILGAWLLAAVSHRSNDQALAQRALSSASFTCAEQKSNGSWAYGIGQNDAWVDNFHTAYVLSGLKAIVTCLGASCFDGNIEKGYQFWKRHFLPVDQGPKYYAEKKHPIDVHNISQTILTGLDFMSTDPTAIDYIAAALNYGLDHFQDPSGFFYYQKTPYYTIKTPYIRWSQAWMFKALTLLHAYIKKDKSYAEI